MKMLDEAKRNGTDKSYKSIKLNYEMGYIEPFIKNGENGWRVTDKGRIYAEEQRPLPHLSHGWKRQRIRVGNLIVRYTVILACHLAKYCKINHS